METIVEPYQIHATLSAIAFVARPLVTGGDEYHFPTGQTHVIPLLRAILPGIDTNDLSKTQCTCQCLSAIFSLVPIVDCTPALKSSTIEMNEIEKELCLQSAQFEEIVLLFIDR